MVLITGGSIWLVTNYFFPNLLVDEYWVIPLFFFILGLVFIGQFPKAISKKRDKLVNLYMLMRMIKIFTSFVFILVYWFIDKQNIRNFAILFIIFYLLNLVWETYIYTRMERYIKQMDNQEKMAKEDNDL
jgi:cell division protein FtsW (lipid II flippase)